MKGTRKLVRLRTNERSEQEKGFASRIFTRIVGQDDAKTAASRAHRSFLNPLRDPDRPIYAIMAIGKSRTGKTLTAEALAEFFHGDKKAMVKINSGAYKEKHRVSQLIGAPPSYVGYKDPNDPKTQPKPGQMDTSAKLSRDNLIASRMGSGVAVTIVLVDEIEKMIDELEDVFLSILDKGEVDLGNNTVADFRDCIFIFTSNLASSEVENLGKPGIGFTTHAAPKDVTVADVKSVVDKALSKRYKPEFLNRLDEVVIYAPLTQAQVRLVVDAEISLLEERIATQLPRGFQFGLDVEKSARDFILKKTYDTGGGVENLKRTIQRVVLDPISSELIKKSIRLGDVLIVRHEGGKDELSFFIAEGEADVADADLMQVVDSAATQNGLGFQRLVDKATRKAARGKRERFALSLRADNMSQLAEASQSLLHDLLKVFGVKLLETSSTWAEPFVFQAVIEAIEEQIKLIQQKYPEVAVARAEETRGSGA